MADLSPQASKCSYLSTPDSALLLTFGAKSMFSSAVVLLQYRFLQPVLTSHTLPRDVNSQATKSEQHNAIISDTMTGNLRNFLERCCYSVDCGILFVKSNCHLFVRSCPFDMPARHRLRECCPRCRCTEGIGEVLRLVHYQLARKFHDGD